MELESSQFLRKETKFSLDNVFVKKHIGYWKYLQEMLNEYRLRVRPEHNVEVSEEKSSDNDESFEVDDDVFDSDPEDFNIFDEVEEELSSNISDVDEKIENLNNKKIKISNLKKLPVAAQIEDSEASHTWLTKAVRFADAAIQAINQLDQCFN